MVHRQRLPTLATLAILGASYLAAAHDHEGCNGAGMETGQHVAHITVATNATSSATITAAPSAHTSYFEYSGYSGLIWAHIILMTFAWFFTLPIGIMLSIARSRLALLVDVLFLSIHSIATLIGMVYRHSTPQLYEYNSHRPISWLVTLVVVAHCVMEAMKLATRATSSGAENTKERIPVVPITTHALERHHQAQQSNCPNEYRYSNDIGHFTASEPSRSQSVSSTNTYAQEEQQKLHGFDTDYGHESLQENQEKQGLLQVGKIERAATGLVSRLSDRTLSVIYFVLNFINRTILVLGFAAFVSGVAVFGGVFRGNDIFNGLAHTIKGGIFFWYGILTLGRWTGCFAEYGWAWNVRPPAGVVSSRQARIPSAEFVESFVIFLYGSTNVFLEHLAAWGKAWTPMDLEHLSITIMFFGGGLCGMLVESTGIRDLLNSVVLVSVSPAGQGPIHIRDLLKPPRTYQHSLNPFPGLVVLLLGLMMSTHHQHSMVSTTIHIQWGMLFVTFALARGLTYMLTYIVPPTSYLPSRPPSELIASFCLISGGLIFMASNRNTVNSLEAHGIHAMFPFTCVMGFTAFLMAWTVIVLAVKGWAVGINLQHSTSMMKPEIVD